MKFKKIILFMMILKKINLMIDYCASTINPEEPNDCVFFSTEDTKCCFNPSNTSQCFEESSMEGLICEEDYFYKFEKEEDIYKQYKDKNGNCTFIYGDIKGAFPYDENIKNVLKIIEVKGLEINCLDNGEILEINILIFILISMIFQFF